MLVKKTGPFAPSHSFTSMMSHPVCCSHSWGKKKSSQREEGATFLANSPDKQRATLYPPLSSQPPLFLTESLLFLSLPPHPSLPPSHSTLHLTISLPSPMHLSSPLSCTHSSSSSSSLALCSSLQESFMSPTSLCHYCSIRHQLFFPGSVLFRVD